MYELVSPINPEAVLKYLGQIMMGIGIVQAAPAVVALIFGETRIAAIYFAVASAVILMGYFMNKLLPEHELELKEGLVLAALIFPLSAIISAIPIYLSTDMSMLDAFFESVSGVTTTGLSVAPTEVGPVFLFSRSWLQWIGGIGIVVLVLSVFIRPGTTAFRIYAANIGDKKIKPSVVAAATLLGKVYIVITLISITLLWLSGMSPFDAVCHALCSVSTGGFSTKQESIGAFSGSLMPAAITFCCVVGSINFGLYPRALKDPPILLKNIQVKYFLAIAAVGIVILSFTIMEGNGPDHAANAAYQNRTPVEIISISSFHALSALTTAGFSTTDVGELPESSKILLSVLMWIGGGIGSTAGGIKIFRMIVLLKLVHLTFMRLFLPSETVTPLKVGDELVEQEELNRITAFVLLYMMIIVLSTFVFTLQGVEMSDALFEVSSALGTVGLSSGVTSAAMPDLLKAVLCANMLLGRIEIVPLFVLFMPRTWIKRSLRQDKRRI
jgi:trk system potassium uptake protein TrkH